MEYKDYFWSHEYRHYMRDLRSPIKRKVFNSFIKFGLKPYEVSKLHKSLILECTGNYVIEGEPLSSRRERLKKNYL